MGLIDFTTQSRNRLIQPTRCVASQVVQTHESTSYCFHGFNAGVSSQTEALLNSVAESHRPKQNIVPPDGEVFCQTVGKFFLQLKLTPAHTA